MLVLKSLGLACGVCVCVCLHWSSGQGREEVWVQELWWSTLLNYYLFVFWTAPTTYLQDKFPQEGPDQSVSNGFWFISRDTAVTCVITTLEYCVLNGPEVQIKCWVSRKKLRSACKNRDGEWWPCERHFKQRYLELFEAPWGTKLVHLVLGNLLLAWEPGTCWTILWWLKPQQSCAFKQTYHILIH